MNSITKYKFADLYEMSSGISTTKGQAGHGSPFVSFSTVFNNYFLPETLLDKMDANEREQEKFSIKKGDILITRTSETIDELAMSCVALKDYPNATFSGFTKRLRPKTSGIAYYKFMAFYLRSKLFRKTVTNNASMTLRASFNEDIFSFLNLYLPPYDQQVKIGDLLYSIEMKIQNNKKINSKLDKQIQTLYDYWFTQYDFPDENGNPYCSTGGKMIYNETLNQKVPNYWSVIEVGEIAKLKSGYSFSSEEYSQNGKYSLITIKNVKNEGIDLQVDNFIENLPKNLPEHCKLKIGDILMSLTGNVGRVGIMYSEKCLLNQRVAVIEPVELQNKLFIYSLFKGKFIKSHLLNLANGSSQANLSPVETEKIKFAYNHDIALKFNNIIHPIIEEIINNSQEIQKLSQLRDWLLPMLMNQQAVISD